MKFKSLKSFTHDELGAIKEGDTVEATAAQAVTPLFLGYFESGKKVADEAEKPAKKAK